MASPSTLRSQDRRARAVGRWREAKPIPHGPTKMTEKILEKKLISPEDIDKIDIRRAALAWQNFIKRLAGEMPENTAKEILIEELKEFANKKEPVNPNIALMNARPEESVAELKKYITGKMGTMKSMFWFSELQRPRNFFLGRPGFVKGKEREYLEARQKFDSLFNTVRTMFEKNWKHGLTDEQKRLHNKFTRTLDKLTERLENFEEFEKIVEGYRTAILELEEIKKELESAPARKQSD